MIYTTQKKLGNTDIMAHRNKQGQMTNTAVANSLFSEYNGIEFHNPISTFHNMVSW